MGRPLTDRWIGIPTSDGPVLMPVINNLGRIGRGYIIKQVGSDRFIVQDASTGELGAYRLCDTAEPPMPGLMSIRFEGTVTGFAMRIANGKIKDWHGNHHEDQANPKLGRGFWQIDLAWVLILAMKRVGLVKRLRRTNTEMDYATSNNASAISAGNV